MIHREISTSHGSFRSCLMTLSTTSGSSSSFSIMSRRTYSWRGVLALAALCCLFQFTTRTKKQKEKKKTATFKHISPKYQQNNRTFARTYVRTTDVRYVLYFNIPPPLQHFQPKFYRLSQFSPKLLLLTGSTFSNKVL